MFEFSDTDSRIMLVHSFFSNSSATNMEDTETLKRMLSKLLAKETRLYLHTVSLSDYLRKRRIPRRLRLQKEHMVGNDNEALCEKRCEIMNNCSFDLMALSIQKLSEQLKKTRAEIEQFKKDSITETFTQERLDTLSKECEQHKLELIREKSSSSREMLVTTPTTKSMCGEAAYKTHARREGIIHVDVQTPGGFHLGLLC